jgi:hypothetical protein
VVERDKDSRRVLYGKELTNAQILDGKITAPVEARSFLAEVRRAKAVAVKKEAK